MLDSLRLPRWERIAMAGVAAGGLFIGLGLITLVIGAGVFLAWAHRSGSWPFVAEA